MTEQTVEDRIAEKKRDDERLRAALAAIDLDGPHAFQGGDLFGSAFGGGRLRYAICLRCGAMVKLDDPTEGPNGTQIERSVQLHAAWHAS